MQDNFFRKTVDLGRHIRVVSLLTYFFFILIFNLMVAPLFGWNVMPAHADTVIDSARLVTLANQSRAAAGLNSLSVDQRLINAATQKGIDMFKKQYWAHYGPNGETPWQFIIAAGYSYTYAGENLAKDFTSTDSVHNAWMNSATHKANILNVNYQNVGIAAISGKQICNGIYPGFSDNNLSTCIDTVIVVQMFGTLQSATSPSGPTKSISSNTIVPTSTPTPQAPNKPQITSPSNNSYVNKEKIDVSGKTDTNTSVNVYDGEKKVGTITSDGGAFTVRDLTLGDGAHGLTADATSEVNGKVSVRSDAVNVTIDTVPPVLDKTNTKLQLQDQSNNDYYIESTFTDDTVAVKATSGQSSIDLQKLYGNTFAGTIKVPDSNVGIVLAAYDKAGNMSTATLDLPRTLGLDNKISSTTAGRVSLTPENMSIKQVVNIIVGVVLLMVFIAESFFVWKNGGGIHHLHQNGVKSLASGAVHHVIPMAVIILAMCFSISGNII